MLVRRSVSYLANVTFHVLRTVSCSSHSKMNQMQKVKDQTIGWVEKCSSLGHISSFLMTALGFMYEHMRPGKKVQEGILYTVYPRDTRSKVSKKPNG